VAWYLMFGGVAKLCCKSHQSSWSCSRQAVEMTKKRRSKRSVVMSAKPTSGKSATFHLPDYGDLSGATSGMKNSSVRLSRGVRGIQCETEAAFWVIPESVLSSR
jgi:hypothetical protein